MAKPQSVSHRGTFGLLLGLSLAAHGLVLAIPYTLTEPADELSYEPPPPTSTAMEVAVLSPDGQKAAADDRTDPADGPNTEDPKLPMEPPPAEPAPPADPSLVDLTDASVELEVDELDTVDDRPEESGSTNNGDADVTPSLSDRLTDVNAYQYDGSGILGISAYGEVLQDWAIGDKQLPSRIEPLKLEYQLATACLNTPPADGTLVAVVDAQGTFVQGPEMISSTGYTVLDEQAKAQLQDGEYPLPARSDLAAYAIPVVVTNYPSCP